MSQPLSLQGPAPWRQRRGGDLLQADDVPGTGRDRVRLLGLARDPPGHVPGDDAKPAHCLGERRESIGEGNASGGGGTRRYGPEERVGRAP